MANRRATYVLQKDCIKLIGKEVHVIGHASTIIIDRTHFIGAALSMVETDVTKGVREKEGSK